MGPDHVAFRIGQDWPAESGYGSYLWAVSYEVGDSDSTTGFSVEFFPDPIGSIGRLAANENTLSLSTEYIRSWRSLNRRERIFSVCTGFEGEEICSNNYLDILREVDRTLDYVKNSRADARAKQK